MPRLIGAPAALVLLCLAATPMAQRRPLPEAGAFLSATRENLARANQVQHRYAYKERRTELHTNPFGRLGTGEVRVYEVTPGPDRSVYFRRLLERDGAPVEDSEPERQERKMRSGRSPVDDVAAVLDYTLDRRESLNGRDAIVVRFMPKPDADPETREGNMAKAFEGEIWVDEQAREVRRVEATAIDGISYGFGIIARLNKGATVTLVREPVDGDIWLPTSIEFTGDGRALLFRKIDIDHRIEWFDYELMPSS